MVTATRECPWHSTVQPLRMKRSPISAIVARARLDVSAGMVAAAIVKSCEM